MDKVEEKYEGTFRILDYSISHKLLLLRSTEIENEEVFNKDILFISVFYIEIKETLEGIILREGDIKDFKYVEKKYGNQLTQLNKVFILESQGCRYYIGASAYRPSENNLLPSKSSIKK